MSIRDWVREKEMLGRRFFTFEELRSAMPELSCQVVKNSLTRLRKSSRIYSPYRGFYVILPPEYVRRGGVPPASVCLPVFARGAMSNGLCVRTFPNT